MGFGTELVVMMMLGFVVLGPKRLHTVLGHVARAKAEFEKASRGIKSQLAAELDGAPQDRKNHSHTNNHPLPRAADDAEPDGPDTLVTRTGSSGNIQTRRR